VLAHRRRVLASCFLNSEPSTLKMSCPRIPLRSLTHHEYTMSTCGHFMDKSAQLPEQSIAAPQSYNPCYNPKMGSMCKFSQVLCADRMASERGESALAPARLVAGLVVNTTANRSVE
jgi:hypothetical protein